MSEAIRATSGGEWFYVPVGSAGHAKLSKLASSGMAEASESEVRLVNEAGPIAWDDVRQREREATPLAALAAMSSDGIRISPGEKVSFGKHGEWHNEFADISLTKDEGHGVAVSSWGPSDGDMVLTAWPDEKRLLPGRVITVARRLAIELPETPKKGSRCFVLDEHGKSLLTVSLASDGSGMVRILPHAAVDSWLFASGSRATKAQAERFSLKKAGSRYFTIVDNKKGKSYAGMYKNDPTFSPDRWALENERLQWMLASRGLSGVLPNYPLENGQEWFQGDSQCAR